MSLAKVGMQNTNLMSPGGEMVDTLVLGTSDRKVLEVQVLSRVLHF